MEETFLRLHRMMFKLDMEIPDWLTKYLDERIAFNKIWAKHVHVPPAHSNPADYGVSEAFVKRKRKEYLKDREDLLSVQLKRNNHSLESIVIYNKGMEAIKREFKKIDNPRTNRSIKDVKRYPIKEYLSSIGVKIQMQTGNRAKCNCPLHNEDTPSFVVYEETNSFYCFGCGVGGSIIDLVMAYEELTLIDAIKKIELMRA